MGWSLRIGRLFGIDVFVHFTFLILLAWIAAGSYVATGDPLAAVAGLLLTGAVFGIIVLHELGHALAARYYGIPTRDITLLPIGGVARLERMPDKPVQELVVALAGPAVNVVLAGVFFAAMLLLGSPAPDMAISFTGDMLSLLVSINVGLALFNMLPAFPMDGGRVLRALLAMRLGQARATQLAATIGRGMAVVFAIMALLPVGGFGPLPTGNPMLLLVALFIWIGAGEEAAAVRMRAGLAGVPVSRLMVRRFAVVDPDDTLQSVAGQLLNGFQQDFPVVDGRRLVGLLTRDDLVSSMSEMPRNARVFQVMRRDIPTIGPDEPAEHGLSLLSKMPVVPVTDHGELVGLLTPEHVGEYISIRRAATRDRERNGVRDTGWTRA
jgi:Zn-dependent protease